MEDSGTVMDLSTPQTGEESPQQPSTSCTDEPEVRSTTSSKGPYKPKAAAIKEEMAKQATKANDIPSTKLLLNMEALITKFLTTPQPTVGNINNIQFVNFNPDDPDADIESWCKLTEMIVHNKKLDGVELLVPLTNALKGRAATCLTKLNVTQISWHRVKEMLLAKFSRPKLMQDYFDDVLNFKIGAEETASQAGHRLWDLIDAVPNIQMTEEAVTGLVISVLCKERKSMELSLRSTAITSRTQLFNVLRGISLRHMHPVDYEPASKKRVIVKKVLGKCANCHVEEYRTVQNKKQKECPSNKKPEVGNTSVIKNAKLDKGEAVEKKAS